MALIGRAGAAVARHGERWDVVVAGGLFGNEERHEGSGARRAATTGGYLCGWHGRRQGLVHVRAEEGRRERGWMCAGVRGRRTKRAQSVHAYGELAPQDA